jgi:integrase/recombinase XerD
MPQQKAQAGKRYEQRVAPGVTQRHETHCRLSRGVKRQGCSCSPHYLARVVRAGVWYRETFPTADAAVSFVETVKRGGTPGSGPDQVAVSVLDAAVRFLERARDGLAQDRSGRAFRRPTIAHYDRHLRKHVLSWVEPRSGEQLQVLPVGGVTQRVVQALASDLAGRTSPSTTRVSVAALSTVLRDAYEQGLTDNEPPSRLRLPSPPSARNRVLTIKQIDKLLAAARADDEKLGQSLALPLLALVAATGLRISEALDLRWGADGLDLGAEPAVANVGAAKTVAGIRRVTIDAETRRILRDHRAANGNPPDGTLVFTSRRGRALDRYGAPRSTLRRVSESVGFEVSFHDLRHSHATMLHSAGVPVAAFAKRLGHSDPRFTMARYVKAAEDDLAGIAKVVEKQRAAARMEDTYGESTSD